MIKKILFKYNINCHSRPLLFELWMTKPRILIVIPAQCHLNQYGWQIYDKEDIVYRDPKAEKVGDYYTIADIILAAESWGTGTNQSNVSPHTNSNLKK